MLLCGVAQWEEVSVGAFLLDRPRNILYHKKRGGFQAVVNPEAKET